jgi:hypothetical protein
MPNLDKTGPKGAGPATGRGCGPCGGDITWKKGHGKFFGWYDDSDMTKEEKIEMLEKKEKFLEDKVKMIKDRIKELKNSK